jgi:hypothetical protein
MPDNLRPQWPVALLLCLLLSLLTGCSALKLGYNQADKVVYLWVDRYVDFDDAQAQRTREVIASWFAWNRRTQLTDYSELLARADTEIMADTTQERACGWWSSIRMRLDRAAEQASPAIADVAVTLKPNQLANIEKRYAKTNQEFRDDFMQRDPGVRHAEAAKRAVSRYEWLYGELDPFQKERLERWAGESPFDPSLTLEHHRRRQQDLLQILARLTREPVDNATARGEIRGWRQRFLNPPDATYRQHNERVIKHNCRVFADLHNSTSTAQRRFASAKLRGWAADLRALAAERSE